MTRGQPAFSVGTDTLVRNSEEIEAPWTEFDQDEASWTIPAERMNTKTPHIVPPSRKAVQALRALKQITGNGHFVFAGARDKKKPINNNTILYALYRLGYRDRMTGHGFRGLASTPCKEMRLGDHTLSTFSELRVQEVRPPLHHLRALLQVLGMVICGSDLVALRVGELQFNVRLVELMLVEGPSF